MTTTAPAFGSKSTLPLDWEAVRNGHTPPRVVSAYTGSHLFRDEFLAGCTALGLDDIKPQQMVTADACNAVRESGEPLFPFMGVLEPRRSSKTTSLVALAIGRCLSRDGYLVGITFATTATKLAARFRGEFFGKLETWAGMTFGPEADGAWPFHITYSNGREQVRFTNGSRLDLLAPKAGAFRSEAYDLVIVDEGGEADAALTDELTQAILPTFDTRDGSQLIVAGTAARFRDGNMLWDTLEDGRNGRNDTGIVEYSAGVDLTIEDVETWDQVVPLLLSSHPGIGTLTTLEKVRRNFEKMPRLKFAAEYLGVFGDEGASAGILAPSKVEAATITAALPEPPERFAVAFSAHRSQVCGAIAAAWRVDGIAHVLLLDHRDGVRWLPAKVGELGERYPSVKFGHDDRGPVMTEVDVISRDFPRIRLDPQRTADVTNAAALFTRELHTGNLRHYGQPDLVKAMLTARRREIGNAFAFGMPDGEGDITGLEAASMALRMYDAMPAPMVIPQMIAQ